MPAASAVPAIDRALSILEAMAESNAGFTLSEIGRKFAIPKSSAHLIVRALEARGYLQRNAGTGKYRFGPRAVGLGRMAFEGLPLRDEARPFLLKLAKQTGLSVHLAILDGSEAIIVEKLENLTRVRVASWIGRRIALNCTSVGKCLMAYLPEPELASRLGRRGLVRHNPKTISSLARIREELARVRTEGYAIDDEEDEIGLRCLGAPIFAAPEQAKQADPAPKEVIAAVSVVGTVGEIPPESFPRIAARLKAAAAAISTHMAGISA